MVAPVRPNNLVMNGTAQDDSMSLTSLLAAPDDGVYLFPGSAQYERRSRFRTILRSQPMLHADELRSMGIIPECIGVHSIRKGACTFVCNESTASFSAASFCSQWKMAT